MSSEAPMTIVLRQAAAGDGAAILDVARASVEGLAATHYDPSIVAGWMRDRTPAYYEADLAAGRTIIAEAAGRAVGFVQSVPGELTRLFVRPEVAGKGLGARLVALGIELALDGGQGPVNLQSTLNARKFYERHGFRFEKHGSYAHGIGGAPVKIAHMILDAAHILKSPRQLAAIMESLA